MTTPDERVREQAQRLHDDVLGTIDLDTALERSRKRSVKPTAVVVSVLAVVALLGAVAVLRPDSGDVDVAIDEDGLTTTVPETPQPDFDGAPAPIALGGPADGKDSVGLPVIVEPATGLVEGQSVSVSGRGFPAGVDVGVVMCTKEAGREHGGRGVEACNISHVGRGTTGSDGNVTVPFTVRRLQTLDGQEIDCASEPGRCIVGMGMISDYDQSGGFAIDFDPSVPLPDPPSVDLSRTEGIVDGETVEIVATGFVPDSLAYVNQCGGELGCVETGYVEAPVDSDGTLRASLRLWRAFGAYSETGPRNIDCVVEECRVVVGGETVGGREAPGVVLTFDPSRGARTAPALRLLDDGPFAPGDTFRVEVTGMSNDAFVDLSVCTPIDQECIAQGGAPAEDGRAVVELRVESNSGACAEDCPIVGSTYSLDDRGPSPSSGPPPLFPEPIMVAITG